jgi:preprotein translocase subunit SecE
MENQYQKWINFSYLALAICIGSLVFAIAGKIVGDYDLESLIKNTDLILRGAAFFSGGLLFLLLYRHERINDFMNEVMGELARVSWPTQRETTAATGIVLVSVLVSGVLLGIFDYFCIYLAKWIF